MYSDIWPGLLLLILTSQQLNKILFISRLLPCLSPLYENHSAVNAVDSALDTLGSAVGKHQVLSITENLRNPQICNQPPQVTKALTSLVDNSPNFLAGTSPSIADLLALSLAVSNKIGKTQRKKDSFSQTSSFFRNAFPKSLEKAPV